ncbi:hypothetical protein ONJ45_26310, partial [Salmonella enterica subsp. enterica serovar Virginia]|nr:hypothetical protein [Salmonella enterica subsp. enterica serovar Virginia]
YGITLVSIRMNDPQQGFIASFISTDAPQQWHMTEITCQLTDLPQTEYPPIDAVPASG